MLMQAPRSTRTVPCDGLVLVGDELGICFTSTQTGFGEVRLGLSMEGLM